MFALDIIVPSVLVATNTHAIMNNTFETPITIVLGILSIVIYGAYYYLFMRSECVNYPPPIFRQTRHQKAAEFPPPFPNGWFMICKSDDLKNGEVKEIVAFGRAYALYRTFPTPTDSQRRQTYGFNKHLGVAHMVEAYCPHLGANLGVAGEVTRDSNCLKCKFHGWEFDGDGKVVKVAGTDITPANGNIKKVYHVCETNGMIHLWHDADDGAPKWDLIHREEINSGRYYLGSESNAHVNCHIQEIPENGADVAHLNVLHKDLVGDFAPNVLAFHNWTASWTVNSEKPFMTNMHVSECVKAWNSYILPLTSVEVDIHQIGPGIVTLDFHTPLGMLILHQCIVPEKVTTQRVRHVLHAAPTVPRPLAKFVLWATNEQFMRDVPIWCTKRFEPKPCVSKADGPLLGFRRWYSQFYSPSSTTFPDALAQETMIDW